MSQTSDFNELKMALFDTCKPKEFLLFLSNRNMPLEVSGITTSNVEIKYLYTMVRVEALYKFHMLSAELGSTTF